MARSMRMGQRGGWLGGARTCGQLGRAGEAGRAACPAGLPDPACHSSSLPPLPMRQTTKVAATHSLVRPLRVGEMRARRATTVARQWRKGPTARANRPTSRATTSRDLHQQWQQVGAGWCRLGTPSTSLHVATCSWLPASSSCGAAACLAQRAQRSMPGIALAARGRCCLASWLSGSPGSPGQAVGRDDGAHFRVLQTSNSEAGS